MSVDAADLTPDQIDLLPVGAIILDHVDAEWEQTAPGRWWDKSYPSDTAFKLTGEDMNLYFRYAPFKLKEHSA